MIINAMTDEEILNLETHLSGLKKAFDDKVNEFLELGKEIQRIESELKHQKILNKTFEEVFPKK